MPGKRGGMGAWAHGGREFLLRSNGTNRPLPLRCDCHASGIERSHVKMPVGPLRYFFPRPSAPLPECGARGRVGGTGASPPCRTAKAVHRRQDAIAVPLHQSPKHGFRRRKTVSFHLRRTLNPEAPVPACRRSVGFPPALLLAASIGVLHSGDRSNGFRTALALRLKSSQVLNRPGFPLRR